MTEVQGKKKKDFEMGLMRNLSMFSVQQRLQAIIMK